MQYWFSNNYIHKSIIQIHCVSLLDFVFKRKKEEMCKNYYRTVGRLNVQL